MRGAVAAVEATCFDILGGYYRLQDLVSKDASSPIWQYLGLKWKNKASQGIWIILHVVSAVSMCNMYNNLGNSTNLWKYYCLSRYFSGTVPWYQSWLSAEPSSYWQIVSDEVAEVAWVGQMM